MGVSRPDSPIGGPRWRGPPMGVSRPDSPIGGPRWRGPPMGVSRPDSPFGGPRWRGLPMGVSRPDSPFGGLPCLRTSLRERSTAVPRPWRREAFPSEGSSAAAVMLWSCGRGLPSRAEEVLASEERPAPSRRAERESSRLSAGRAAGGVSRGGRRRRCVRLREGTASPRPRGVSRRLGERARRGPPRPERFASLAAGGNAPPPQPSSTAIWLILPVAICLSQRLSHACPSTSLSKVKPRMAH